MQTLDLDIEDELRVDLNAVHLLDVGSELFLLRVFDLVEFLDSVGIDVSVELFHLAHILEPARADAVGDEGGELGVAQTQPAALSDTVGLVLEALGIYPVPFLENVVLEDLGVDPRNAVDIGGYIHRESCHMDFAVTDDAHRVDVVLFYALILKVVPLTLVDALDDSVDLGDDHLHQTGIPLLQCLSHNGVVGVIEGLLSDIEGIVKVNALILEQTDQLGDGYDRMGIVELDGGHLREVREVVIVFLLISADDILQRSGGEEVLLL